MEPHLSGNGPRRTGRLRVAVLLSGREQFSVYYGGAVARWTFEVYKHLHREIDVTVFGFPTDPNTRYALPHESSSWWKVCVAISRIRGIARFDEGIWLRALVKRLHHFDVVHVHNRPQWAAMLRRMGYRGRIIVHLHNDHLGHWTPEALNALVPKLDALVVCSTYLGQRSSSKSSALAAKTELIFNGVNTEIFYPSEHLRERKTIFFVGQFLPQKGVLQLVEAFARVLQVHGDAKLVIGGSANFGIDKETPYIRQVRERAEQIRRKSGAEIQFLGSVHHDKELPAWFQRATVFTSPSLFQEPFGLVNAEAMACSTPVVGTNRGGVPEVLGEAGVVIDPENIPEYAAALIRLLADPAECRQLGQAARERSERLFDWRVIADRWLLFLGKVKAMGGLNDESHDSDRLVLK